MAARRILFELSMDGGGGGGGGAGAASKASARAIGTGKGRGGARLEGAEREGFFRTVTTAKTSPPAKKEIKGKGGGCLLHSKSSSPRGSSREMRGPRSRRWGRRRLRQAAAVKARAPQRHQRAPVPWPSKCRQPAGRSVAAATATAGTTSEAGSERGEGSGSKGGVDGDGASWAAGTAAAAFTTGGEDRESKVLRPAPERVAGVFRGGDALSGRGRHLSGHGKGLAKRDKGLAERGNGGLAAAAAAAASGGNAA
eukprot:g9563.t1